MRKNFNNASGIEKSCENRHYLKNPSFGVWGVKTSHQEEAADEEEDALAIAAVQWFFFLLSNRTRIFKRPLLSHKNKPKKILIFSKVARISYSACVCQFSTDVITPYLITIYQPMTNSADLTNLSTKSNFVEKPSWCNAW